MAGHFPTSDTEHRRSLIIERWMLSNLETHGYERYEDLHIDEIDPAWLPRDTWIEGGAEAFRLAVGIRDQRGLDFSVALAYSLTAEEEPLGVDFNTLDELAASLHASSPPSLYLFKNDSEPSADAQAVKWKMPTDVDMNVTKELDHRLCAAFGPAKRCYCNELRQLEYDEYSRSFVVEG